MEKRVLIGISVAAVILVTAGVGAIWYVRSRSLAEIQGRTGTNLNPVVSGNSASSTKTVPSGQQASELKTPDFKPGEREAVRPAPTASQGRQELADLAKQQDARLAEAIKAERGTSTVPVVIPGASSGGGQGSNGNAGASGTLDPDGDGLTTNQELQLGTDPNNPDTDQDGLKDGEEVNLYKTNPKNPDSDNDTYNDAQEIKSGYNPLGTGKCTVPSCIP